jgi:hypothetical protein
MLFNMPEREFTVADLDKPQFTRPQVALITGLTDGQLKGILDRKLVRLKVHNPGSGNPRLFTGSEVIKTATAAAFADIKVPMETLLDYSNDIDARARELLRSGADIEPKIWIIWEIVTRDDPVLNLFKSKWILRSVPDLSHVTRNLSPVSFRVVQVDKIVLDTAKRIAGFWRGDRLPRIENSLFDLRY